MPGNPGNHLRAAGRIHRAVLALLVFGLFASAFAASPPPQSQPQQESGAAGAIARLNEAVRRLQAALTTLTKPRATAV